MEDEKSLTLLFATESKKPTEIFCFTLQSLPWIPWQKTINLIVNQATAFLDGKGCEIACQGNDKTEDGAKNQRTKKILPEA